MTDNDTGIPDLGPEASTGFRSQVNAHQAPYSRANSLGKRRPTTMDGGSFQSATKSNPEPIVDNFRESDEKND
jgi:hypothetical protein